MTIEDYLVKTYIESYHEDKHLILVIYDIVDDKRRTVLFKALSGYLTAVQKSCFESYVTDTQFNSMMREILDIIVAAEDNVRVYRLSASGKLYNLGKEPENQAEAVIII